MAYSYSNMASSCCHERAPAQAPQDVALAAKSFLALADAAATLICLEGELWLTRDGDIEDYLLVAGQRFAVRPGDKVAVLALRNSSIRLHPAPVSGSSMGRSWLAGLLARCRPLPF